MSFKRSLVTLCAAMAASMSAQAAFQFELTEVGSNVVLTGSGSFNVAGLTPTTGWVSGGGFLGPNSPFLQIGAFGAKLDMYSVAAVPAGASTFGTYGFIPAGVSTGDTTSFASDLNHVFGPHDWRFSVPAGYVSGTQLSGSATFTGTSFASLGITPGTYAWTWGSGATADSVTLTAAVPEPSTYAMALAGLGILGVWARRQKRIRQRPAEAATA